METQTRTDPSDMKSALKALIATELLEGEAEGIAHDTPLLELGLINSMSIMLVVSFIEQNYQVNVPSEHLTPENLRSIDSIAAMVQRLRHG